MNVVENPRITSDYGVTRVLPDGTVSHHEGIDVVSDSGIRTVYAVTDGTVVYDFDAYEHARRYSKPHTGGNMVILVSEIGGELYFIRYLHLYKNRIGNGQYIPEGTPIGEYGDVGYSFGAHVHVDVWNYTWTKRYNPRSIIPDIV